MTEKLYTDILTDFWKEENSKKEKVTETVTEVWLVENDEKIRLIEKSTNTHKELISERKENK